jgi:hypothetical protein
LEDGNRYECGCTEWQHEMPIDAPFAQTIDSPASLISSGMVSIN